MAHLECGVNFLRLGGIATCEELLFTYAISLLSSEYKSISKRVLYYHKYRAKTQKNAPTHSSTLSLFPYIATVFFIFEG